MRELILLTSDGSALPQKTVEAGLQVAAQLKARTAVVTVSQFYLLFLRPWQAKYSICGCQAYFEKALYARAKRSLSSVLLIHNEKLY
jgi:hypothetical protein